MIVAAMNWQEILKEYRMDYDIVLRKAKYLYNDKLRRRIVKEKLSNFLDVEEYVSPHHNQWLLILIIKNNKTDPKLMPVCIYNDKRGVNAIYNFDIPNHSDKIGLVRFCPHCIKRYRSRLKLDITKPIKIVEHICRNILSNTEVLKQIELNDENVHVYMPVTGGGFLGFYDEGNYIVDLRTFISDELMRSDQIQRAMALRSMNIEEFPDVNWNRSKT